MEQTKKLTKEKKLKIALSVTALLLVLVVAYLLLIKNSGAWLLDKGQWSNANYTIGRIDYTYEINGGKFNVRELENEKLVATVPIIGGVKLNDRVDDTTADNYEKYAEENFNEGVTVAHIEVQNKGDFDINLTYELLFENMFDGKNPQDLFYLILPADSVVETKNKTVTLKDGSPQSYKAYLSSVMSSHSTYEEMRDSLITYYQDHLELKKPAPVIIKKEDSITFDILFWSEYNSKLPFVTDVSGKDDVLMTATDQVQKLAGTFTVQFKNVGQAVVGSDTTVISSNPQ